MSPADRRHLALMLVLTFTTGINDAVGYLGLDKVFTGNMTGNVVVLGMGLAGASGLPVLGPALALLGFMVGAAAGGRALKGVSEAWGSRTGGLFGIVSALMLSLGVVLAVAGKHPSHPVAVTVTTVAAVAMGLQAATARQVAVKDVTTVVVTSTITGLAADSPFGNGSSTAWRRRAGAIVLILAGALLGALLLRWEVSAAMLLAGALAGAVTIYGHRRRVA
jgi:uncharacterized membrane protein YoaK (UPF0700 family)